MNLSKPDLKTAPEAPSRSRQARAPVGREALGLIGRRLRVEYGDAADAPIPDDLVALLRQVEDRLRDR